MLVLEKQCVLLDLKSVSKDAVLKELAGAVHCQFPEIKIEKLSAVLREREQIGSTGVGNGVAIPHGKIPGLNRTVLSFGRSRKGISFDAVDNRPVHIFVLIMSPMGMGSDYLKTLAQVSRLLKFSSNRSALLEAVDEDTVISIFAGPAKGILEKS